MTRDNMENDAFLNLKNITTTFGSITALDNISFKIKKGEVVLSGERSLFILVGLFVFNYQI